MTEDEYWDYTRESYKKELTIGKLYKKIIDKKIKELKAIQKNNKELNKMRKQIWEKYCKDLKNEYKSKIKYLN